MTQIRNTKQYILYKTEDKMYFVLRLKDSFKTQLMTQDQAENLILEDNFEAEINEMNLTFYNCEL